LGPYEQMFLLTPPAIRRRFQAAFLLVGLVGVLEVFSLSALMTFFTLGLNGGGDAQTRSLTAWMGAGGVSPSAALLVLALGLFVVKAFVVLIVGRYSYHTATAAKRYFQEQLFERFLQSPFQSQTEKRSADWVRNVTADCNALEGRFFMPVLVLLGEIIPALCICGVLFLVSPIAFFVAIGIFVVVGLSIFFATHRRLVHLGRAQQTADGNIVQSVQQAFHGLRELAIYNLEAWAQQRFESFTRASSRAINEALFIGLLPRFVFEVAIYVSLGLVFMIYALQGTPFIQVAGELAVFGAAATRLLPSVSKVVSHLQSLKHAKPAIVVVTDALLAPVAQTRHVEREREPALVFGAMNLLQVGFAYDERMVLGSLNVEIVAGDMMAVVGASGSGKSTLISIVLGLLQPTQGRVMLNGASLTGQETQWWACVGYVPQEPFLMDASAIENVMLGSAGDTNKSVARARNLIDQLGLPEPVKGLTYRIGESGARLSGGQRQRIAIARALYRNPQVLILDEATSAMDASTQARVMDTVIDVMRGRTVLMITHRTETLGYCNKILTLPEGRLVPRALDNG